MTKLSSKTPWPIKASVQTTNKENNALDFFLLLGTGKTMGSNNE